MPLAWGGGKGRPTSPDSLSGALKKEKEKRRKRHHYWAEMPERPELWHWGRSSRLSQPLLQAGPRVLLPKRVAKSRLSPLSTPPVSLWTIRLVLASHRSQEKDVSNCEPCLCWLSMSPRDRHVWSLSAYCPVFHIWHTPPSSLKCSFPISPWKTLILPILDSVLPFPKIFPKLLEIESTTPF